MPRRSVRFFDHTGSGCAGSHDQLVALAERLAAPVAYTSRAKDFLEHDNSFAVGVTGVFGVASGPFFPEGVSAGKYGAWRSACPRALPEVR